MIKIFKKILYLLFSILLLIVLFFLVDLTDVDNSYTNRSLIEIDSKNLNSRHSFKISTYLRYYYLKAYKVINKETYKKRWEIEDKNIRNNFLEEITIKGKINDFSNQSYPLEEYSTSNNWFRSHGNNFSTRFSNFNTINNENAKNLKLAWVYSPINEKNYIYNVQANPIFYKGNIFLPNSQNQIVSINGLTGEQNWKFNVDKGIAAKRGMIIYESKNDNNEPRIFFVNNRNRLFSLNANTGKPIENFGKNGEVEVGLTPIPPTIYKNQLIIITTSSILKVYDLDTGKLNWKYKINETKNSILFPNFEKGSPWGGFSLDEKRGLLFFTTGNPEEWHVGVDRPGDNLYANSVVAFNIEEKKIEWHFQEIQHDIWNLDIAAAPILTMVKKNDKFIDVVVAVTKLGNTLILDRESGEPLFDIIKRRAPISNVPGERTSPYQLDISIPEPVCRNKFKKDGTDYDVAKRWDFRFWGTEEWTDDNDYVPKRTELLGNDREVQNLCKTFKVLFYYKTQGGIADGDDYRKRTDQEIIDKLIDIEVEVDIVDVFGNLILDHVTLHHQLLETKIYITLLFLFLFRHIMQKNLVYFKKE